MKQNISVDDNTPGFMPALNANTSTTVLDCSEIQSLTESGQVKLALLNFKIEFKVFHIAKILIFFEDIRNFRKR